MTEISGTFVQVGGRGSKESSGPSASLPAEVLAAIYGRSQKTDEKVSDLEGRLLRLETQLQVSIDLMTLTDAVKEMAKKEHKTVNNLILPDPPKPPPPVVSITAPEVQIPRHLSILFYLSILVPIASLLVQLFLR